MGLEQDQIQAAWQGALLHDIGKMGISEAILLKAEALSAEELKILQTHPSLGSDLIQEIEYLSGARAVVNGHHERFDGTGFPQQLKGDQIPVPVQLFSIVDCWDTSRSGRPCRPALSEEDALVYIKDQAGRKFDPEIVERFLDLVEKFKLQDSDQ
jgi:HD-GYP domain-containing protein (c-di-GMP phosphodiesterase class II)